MGYQRPSQRAIFPGSFDPFTLGHYDVTLQALRIFSNVTIAIGNSPTKNPLFSPEERISMIRHLWKDHNAVTVEGFSGLVVDYAKSQGCGTLIRGLRTEADFSYEMPMALTNQAMGQVVTVFFPTNPKYSYISSSLVREVARHKGNVTPFLPPSLVEAVHKKTTKGSNIP